MRINYNVTGSKRKELVQAVADFLAVHPVYLGAPTFAYKVGGCQVDIHGVLTTPDTGDEVTAVLLDMLKQRGFEPFHDEEPASTVETAPTGTEDYSYIVETLKTGLPRKQRTISPGSSLARQRFSRKPWGRTRWKLPKRKRH